VAIYYVDFTTGDDGDTGLSEALAWKTIAKVNGSSFSAGDSILFKKGEVWREMLTMPSSGSAGNVITLGTYGSGAAPIISGSDIVTGWTLENIVTVVPLSPMPLSYWYFEDAASPSLDGNGVNNLTWAGSAAQSATHHEGTYSIATPTTSDNAFITLANESATFPFKGTTTGFTIGGWINIKGNFAAFRSMAAHSDFSSRGWLIAGSGTIGKFRARVYSAGGTATIDQAGAAYTGDGWHHVVLRWNGENVANAGADDEISFWIDGVKESTTVTRTSVALNTAQSLAFIGAADGALNYDEWFVFTEAITDTVIGTIYTSGLSALGSSTNFDAYKKVVSVQPSIVYETDTRLGEVITTKNNLTAGTFFWDAGGGQVYIRTTGDDDPAGYTMEVGQRAEAIYTNDKTNITIDGLTLRDGNSHSIVVGSVTVTNNIVQNCILERSALDGIDLRGSTTAINAIVDSCTIRNNGGWGIWVDNAYSVGGELKNNTITGNGLVSVFNNQQYSGIQGYLGLFNIFGNTIYDNTHVGNTAGLSHGIYVLTSAVVTNIYQNTIYGHLYGDGIKLIGSANVYRNEIYGNASSGVEAGQNSSTNVVYAIYSNVIYGNNTAETSSGITEQTKGAGTLSLTIWNNTIWKNGGTTQQEVKIADNLTAFDMRNNLIVATDTRRTLNMVTQSAATIDYNLHWRADGAPNINHNGAFPSWATWQATYDTNGVNADPLLTDPGNDDFTLQAASPAKNAGVDVGLTVDFIGAPIYGLPDIGAYEYTPTTLFGAVMF